MKTNHTPEFLVLYHSLRERTLVDKNWTAVAMSFNSPLITRGHIYKIVDKGWEPLKNDLRAALGLPPLCVVSGCPACGTVHTHAHDERSYNPATQVVKPKPRPRRYRDLFDTPVKVLAWQLENRKEM